METEYESSRIERAKRGLYKPLQGEVPKEEYHQELTPTNIEVASDWGDTTIELPTGRWNNLLTGDAHEGGSPVALSHVLQAFPVAVLAGEEI